MRVNRDAANEYERLRQKNYFVPLTPLDCPTRSITIALLNTRSLQKHAVDITNDIHLCNSDILCLTETQLCLSSNLDEIKHTLGQFTVEFNNSTQSKFQSLAICHQPVVCIKDHVKAPGISLIRFRKEGYLAQTINLLLIYREPSQPKVTLYNDLSDFLQFDDLDVIMGDFNIDAIDPANQCLQDLLDSYELIVKDPTHLSGGLIDHVYIKKTFLTDREVKCIVKNIYFSDHDAICFNISNFEQ